VLSCPWWSPDLQGKIAMVLNKLDAPPDENFSDETLVLTHPLVEGEFIWAQRHEVEPLET